MAPMIPGKPGKRIAERFAVCSICKRRVPELLIGTDLAPKGVWIKVCTKCGS